jgi:hypothetical protein
MSYQQIERIAADVRRCVCPGLEPDQRLPGVTLFEQLEKYTVGAHALPLSYEVRDIPSLGLTEFDAERKEITVVLSARSYQGVENRDARARYTLCHEIGHAVLHVDILVELGLMPHGVAMALHRAQRTHEHFRDTEWQANAFSSALLVPAEGLRRLESHGRLTASRIVDAFEVSHEAASIRLGVFQQRRRQLL